MLVEPVPNPPRRRPPYGIYAYTAREWDPEINLYYYRARYYDPKVGRFISEDPIGLWGGLNRFAYVGNAPVSWADPLGLMEVPSTPGGLPPEWQPDPTHLDPNGERFRHPGGDVLDFHPGREGEKGNKGKDHWHHNKGKKHLFPGDEIPDPVTPPENERVSCEETCQKVVFWLAVGVLVVTCLTPVPGDEAAAAGAAAAAGRAAFP